MSSLESTRASLALLALYLGKTEARDKICRAIQYGAKFVSAGESGIAQGVEKNTSLARKVFRLLKAVNELQNLLAPPQKATPAGLAVLQKVKSALMAAFLTLDQVVWLGRSNILQDKDTTDTCSKVSLYCWMGGCCTGSIVEAWEIARLATVTRRIEKEIQKAREGSSVTDISRLREELLAVSLKSNERCLSYLKNTLDIVVAVGLLQLAPNHVTPRVTGAIGFVTSIISCYQLFPSQTKVKVV